MPDPIANLAISTVAVAPSPAASGTTLTLAAGEGARFPDPATVGAYNVTVSPAGALPTPANAEILRVTARASDVLTVARAQEGTTARTVVVGDVIALTITAKGWNDLMRGRPAWPRPQVGENIGIATFNNTQGGMPANGTVDLAHYYLPEGTYDAVLFRVAVAGSAGALIRAIIYNDDDGGLGPLLTQTDTSDGATAGGRLMPLFAPIVAGPGGIAFRSGMVLQGNPATNPSVQFHRAPSTNPWSIRQANQYDDHYTTSWAIRVTGITGVAPMTPPAGARSIFNENACKLYFRRSA